MKYSFKKYFWSFWRVAGMINKLRQHKIRFLHLWAVLTEFFLLAVFVHRYNRDERRFSSYLILSLNAFAYFIWQSIDFTEIPSMVFLIRAPVQWQSRGRSSP